jgi:hypothetical protein
MTATPTLCPDNGFRSLVPAQTWSAPMVCAVTSALDRMAMSDDRWSCVSSAARAAS